MATSIINYIWLVTCLSFFIIKDNVWSSCLNFPITLDCEIPQYLEVVTFCHSLRLLFIPAMSSLQSTFTTKLPVAIPFHVIMPSFLPSFLPILSAPAYRTHSPRGPLFLHSLLSHILHWGFCCVINMKSSKLVPGCYISGPQYFLSNLLLQSTAKFYPSQYLPFLSHTHAQLHCLLLLFILHLLYFIHFVLLWVHSLWDVDYIAISNSPEYCLFTISHIPTQVVLFSPHAALTTDQASSCLLSGYYLATLHLGCSSFIVMIFLDFLVSIFWSSSLFHLIVPVP